MKKSIRKRLQALALPASVEAYTALFVCKGGPMRDRRLRRPKDARVARLAMEE